jgi:transcriptional regulator with XRE-family HTH domain
MTPNQLVELAKTNLNINKPNAQMTNDDIRQSIRWIGNHSFDTSHTDGEKPRLGRIGIDNMLLVTLLVFPDYYMQYQLTQRNWGAHMNIKTGMNKAELAHKLGVSRTYVTLLTQGKRQPGPAIVDKLTQLMLTTDWKAHPQMYGPLAQLAEHLTFNQGVAGSRPARPTSFRRSSIPGDFLNNKHTAF